MGRCYIFVKKNMRNILLVVIGFLSFCLYGQDVSGSIGGAISTTLHSSNSSSKVGGTTKKPVKVLYVFEEDVKLPNTFILYRGKEYQVYKNGKGKTFFYYNKQKIFFIKKR